MSELNIFLKVLNKFGYPNPNVINLARMSDYDLNKFLNDLFDEVGEDGVIDFCEKAINKLQGEDGLRVDLGGEYCYIKIFPQYYDKGESETDIIVHSVWGDSKILSSDPVTGDEGYFTIQEIIDTTDMSGWSDLDELLDHIKGKAYNIVFQNCGFGVWWI